MSSFFKSIVVQLDKNEFPSQWNMAWSRVKTTEDVDTFTFTRKSKKESTANIYLHLADTHIEKYAASSALKATLGLVMPHYTRTELIMKMWQYIRQNELQDPSRRSGVICDDALKGMFDLERFEYDDLPDLIHSQLSPTEPIQISYQIRFLQDPRDSEVTYDIPVEVENPQTTQFNLNSHQTAISDLNRQIHENLDRINSKKRKRAFYMDFATDPLNFMAEWTTSQIRDHSLVANPAHPDADFDHSTDFFLQPLAASAVHDYAVQLPSRMPQDVYYVDNEDTS
jgi:SWI/SNF-related matrix-associated actin-dependent regulator of chromatin subfamily D